MNEDDPVLPLGKLPATLLRELLASDAEPPPELLVGPKLGEDACAIAVEAGALVAATDPITLTGSGVGAHAVVVNANDVAVMGARPRWFLACALLPEGTRVSAVRALFGETRAALRTLDAHLVGGHTEVSAAVRQPVVVGQMLGTCETGRVVPTGGVREGDCILQVGPAPVEGAAVLAHEASSRLAEVDPALRARASAALEEPGISVVEPALRAAALGATAMHDPTEGGLSAGLHELAEASGVALRVDPDAVLWFEPGCALARAVGADPWGLLASGALLAAFAHEGAAQARSALTAAGFAVAEIARAEPGEGVSLNGAAALPRYERDELSRVLGAD